MRKLVLAILAVVTMVITSCSPSGPAFGIDVSQYNGDIDWSMVKSQKKTKDPIKFVIIRSSMGSDGADARYQKNYDEAKEEGFIVGSYHFYRPNENSANQFQNFKNTVKLEKGDILPVIDIEGYSSVQSLASLKVGLRNFVNLVEEEYGVKPIIYTKLAMWNDISADFQDCKVWIAAYTQSRRDDEVVKMADIHQFTNQIKDIPGIPSRYVDGDDVRDIGTVLY